MSAIVLRTPVFPNLANVNEVKKTQSKLFYYIPLEIMDDV